jgi:hypothetical protein
MGFFVEDFHCIHELLALLMCGFYCGLFTAQLVKTNWGFVTETRTGLFFSVTARSNDMIYLPLGL